MGDDIVQLTTENESLNSLIGSYIEKWLEVSTAKLLKQFNGKK